MAEPTPGDLFCVRRLKGKLAAVVHHLGDAKRVAVALSPEMLEQMGFRAQLAVAEGHLAQLHSIIHGQPYDRRALESVPEPEEAPL